MGFEVGFKAGLLPYYAFGNYFRRRGDGHGMRCWLIGSSGSFWLGFCALVCYCLAPLLNRIGSCFDREKLIGRFFIQLHVHVFFFLLKGFSLVSAVVALLLVLMIATTAYYMSLCTAKAKESFHSPSASSFLKRQSFTADCCQSTTIWSLAWCGRGGWVMGIAMATGIQVMYKS